jgi:hypothetical protein
MATANLPADISVDTLVRSAQQLSEPEFNRFASAVLAIRAERAAPSVSNKEAELLLESEIRMPERSQARYDALIAKRDCETLTPAEHDELLELTQESESLDVRRVRALTRLAFFRGLTLDELMRQLQFNGQASKE